MRCPLCTKMLNQAIYLSLPNARIVCFLEFRAFAAIETVVLVVEMAVSGADLAIPAAATIVSMLELPFRASGASLRFGRFEYKNTVSAIEAAFSAPEAEIAISDTITIVSDVETTVSVLFR